MTHDNDAIHLINAQTFVDLGMWLTHPNAHTNKQLGRLLDEDNRLPLIKLINKYWLGGAVYHSLKDSTVWLKLDNQLKLYLKDLEQFYNRRNIGLKEEAIFACRLLKESNIPVIILKGGASLFNGVFTPVSKRFMTDIDLLIPEELQDKANEVLIQSGYLPQIAEDEIIAVGHHHSPPLFRPEGNCCIEIHRWVLRKANSNILSTSEVWERAISLELTKSLSVLQMEPNQQIVLSIAHSELSHRGYETKHIDWRQFLNVYCILKHFQKIISWEVIFSHFSRCNKKPPLYALLFALKKYFRLDTTINFSDKLAKVQIESCIHSYIKSQGKSSKMDLLKSVINGYTKKSILVMYGDEVRFPILKGRLKHFRRHLLMLYKRIQ